MIVWGGYNAKGYFSNGGCYDFSANSWKTTPTTGAPSARAYHSAVWTSGEMIVWGGYNGSYLSTGGRYVP
jgi:hypothetical protein